MDSGYWIILWFVGYPVFWILVRVGVPWRLSSLAIPVGVLVGGVLSGVLAFLPVWAEWGLLLWLAVSMYGMMLVIGRFHKPWAEEQGWRWSAFHGRETSLCFRNRNHLHRSLTVSTLRAKAYDRK